MNIVYLLDDPGGDGLTGALRNLLDGQRTRFAAWQAVTPENKEARQRAEQLASDVLSRPGTRARRLGRLLAYVRMR